MKRPNNRHHQRRYLIIVEMATGLPFWLSERGALTNYKGAREYADQLDAEGSLTRIVQIRAESHQDARRRYYNRYPDPLISMPF